MLLKFHLTLSSYFSYFTYETIRLRSMLYGQNLKTSAPMHNFAGVGLPCDELTNSRRQRQSIAQGLRGLWAHIIGKIFNVGPWAFYFLLQFMTGIGKLSHPHKIMRCITHKWQALAHGWVIYTSLKSQGGGVIPPTHIKHTSKTVP